MEKKTLAIGLTVLLLVALLSGCVEDCPDADANSAISVRCLQDYPFRYENKSIVVKGDYAPFGDRDGCIHGRATPYANYPYNLDFELMDGVNISTLVEWKEYYWTGTFHIFYYENGTYYTEFFEVSDIQPV
ncbi:MAG: hypothetical protein KAW45_06155 [Thermoplasmatales archaeon]|nr:hypothetical protein [Thermoplasmatales archaeon]